MAIIVNFDTATLEALVATLSTAEAADDNAESVAFAPLARPADEPNAVQRLAARQAAQTATIAKNAALKALTDYIDSIT